MSRSIQIVQTCGSSALKPLPLQTFRPPAQGFPAELNQICLYENLRFQEIVGFGGAFTEATATVFSRLPPVEQQRFIDACFDQETGLGYSFCRTTIHSCDFAIGNYAYDDVDDDFTLSRFSIKHDHETILPLIRRAMEKAPSLLLLASPWSPPAWMKDTGRMNGGGCLRPECFDVWARYITRYIREYEVAGVPIWGVTAQNEPAAAQSWESCVYTAAEEADFIGEHLGPTLEREGLGDRKILFWDYNKHMAVARAQGVMAHASASKYAHGIAVHWYSGDHFEALDYIRQMYPELRLYNTEACLMKQPGDDERSLAEKYAHDIIGDLNQGVSGWIDWNLLLDEWGGPNHIGNFCHAPIYAKDGRLHFEPSYFYLTHLSRYIKRGARRIGVSRYTDQIACTAVQNPDGRYITVLLNAQDEAERVVLNCHYGVHEMTLPAHSITTVIY